MIYRRERKERGEKQINILIEAINYVLNLFRLWFYQRGGLLGFLCVLCDLRGERYLG